MSDKLRIHTSLRIFASLAAFMGSFALGACFDGLDSTGLPCTNDDQCGTKNSCIEGFCGGLFACPDGELVNEDKLCDGKLDCSDGSDEDFDRCFGDTEAFECSDGVRIPAELACDGVADCADDGDEAPVMCAGVGVNTCESSNGDLGYELDLAREVIAAPRELQIASLIGSPEDDVIMLDGTGDQLRLMSFEQAGAGPDFVFEGFGASKIVDFELGQVNDDALIDVVVATTGTDPSGADAGIYVFAKTTPMAPPSPLGIPSTLPGLLDAPVMGIELGRLDADDRSDVVVIVDGAIKGRVFVAVGDQAAADMGGAYFSFAAQESFSLDYETFLDSAMTDLDDDGDSDLLVTSITEGKGVLWIVKRSGADGEGPVEWDPPALSMVPFPGRELALGRFSPMAMSDDVVILDSQSGAVHALMNQGGTLMPSPPWSAVEGGQISGLMLADMNCDGLADFLFNVGNPAQVRVYLGNGMGGSMSEDPVIYASGGTPSGALGVLHADGDATPDIVSTVGPGEGVSNPELRLLVTAGVSN